MNEKLFGLAQKLWPKLTTADVATQRNTTRQILLTGYSIPLALAGLIWLLLWTTTDVLINNWWLLLLFLAWRYILARLDFSAVLDAGDDAVRGIQGRFVTWIAVLVLGPAALWLDVGFTLLLFIHAWFVRRVPDRWRPWHLVNHLFVDISYDLLPALIALWVYQRWGGFYPLPGLIVTELWRPFNATLIKIGVYWLLLAVMFAITTDGRRLSRLSLVERVIKGGLSLVIFHALPELFAVVMAGIYVQNELWAFLVVLGGVVAVGGLAHYLNQTAVRYRERTRQLYQLERLARAILNEPAQDTPFSELLATHVPPMFAAGWLEIRLLPDQILYFQGDGWIPSEDVIWTQLAQTGRSHLRVTAEPEAVRNGFGQSGLVVPVKDEETRAITGGIYLLREQGKDVMDWLVTTQALAAQIASGVNRTKRFEAALESQAKVYREEIYAQAYQAEVALAYEKLTQELSAAYEIQTSFLPQTVPELNGWQLAVTLEPAKETSGDFYDFIPLPDGRLGILVADVADKGMGAALYMALSRTLIRIYAVQHDTEPQKALEAANHRILADTNSDLFVTVFYAILEPKSGRMTYCNAGHNPPLLQSPNDHSCQTLTRTALPLGIFEDEEWKCDLVQIEPGELLVLYTDGVTEAEDEERNYFGEHRLQAIVRAYAGRSAEVIENKIVSAIEEFVGDAPHHDDITLMIILREP